VSAARTLEERVTDVPVLDAAGCRAVRARIEALRASWTRRHPTAPFYTLGASNYFDIAQNPALPYYRMAAELNPLLMEHFGDLLRAVARALAGNLNMPVGFTERLAHPGFHIFEADEAFRSIRGLTHREWFRERDNPAFVASPIHCDTPHYVVDWGEDAPRVAMNRPISFTLAISTPASGAGMYVWDLRMPETAGYDDARLHEALAARRRILRRYRDGAMAVHDGMSYHQVAPMEDPRPGEMRITLQGHGVPVAGVMRLFW
jgi:hypothetical protein